MNDVRETINTMLVKTFHEILELEEKAIITDEFSDISNNDMHIIEAIGLGDGARMSVVAKRLNITVGSLTTSMNSLVNKGYVARARSEKDRRVVNVYLLEKGTVAASDLTTGAGIGVSTEVDVAGSQLNVAVTSDAVSANYFTSDNTTYITQIAGNSGTGYVVLTQRSASTTHNHSCVCGAVHAQSNGHDTEENLTNWVGISDLNLITGAGNYYLTDNVTLTEAIAYDSGSYCGWKVPDGVVLCLNGKNITMQNPDDLVSESGKAKNADV